jgi:hypothetical protein
MNKYYVYLHIKSSNWEPFYVGKGCGNRAYIKHNRSKYWNSISSKYGYDVIFLDENLDEEDSLKLETYWINRIGRKDIGLGTLINFSNGGESGPTGYKHTEQAIDKISNSISIKMIGNSNWCGRTHKDESKNKISISKIGKKGHSPGQVSIDKLIKLNIEKKSKVILDIETGIYYSSLKEASILLVKNYSYLSEMLRGEVKNKTNLRYV